MRKNDTNKRKYNCRASNNCPLDGKCLLSKSVYSAEVLISNNQHGDQYFGIRETEFKTRLSNHKNSIKKRQKEKDSELPKYKWNLKDKNITNYSIRGEWPSGWRHCSKNWRVPSPNSTRHSARLMDPTLLRGSRWPSGRKYKTQWLTLGEWGCPLDNGPKLAVG